MNSRKIGKNLILTFLAQAISILVNFILNIITPKFISEYQYAYWQTFVLYLSYVGVLHFGLLDGLVLRYSQYDYEELNKEEVRSQFYTLLCVNSICTIIMLIISKVCISGINQRVLILVAIGIITKNVYTYNSYSFQITNRIRLYAFLTIAQKLIYGLAVVVLLLLKVDNWVWYCIADLLGDLAGIIACCTVNKEICFGSPLSIKKTIEASWKSISVGVKLLVSTWASMFLVGYAKMIVQWKWDELVFGKVSFAFSITTLFMTFINAISVVLFPMLKRMKEEELPTLYSKIRDVLSPMLIMLMCLYFPGCWILELWIPKYVESLAYVAILLPTVIYTSKVNLLTNNYLKAYRKEISLLVINVSTFVFAFGLFYVFAYILNSLIGLLLSVVVAIAARSIISELIVAKIINISLIKEQFFEIVMTAVFIGLASLNNSFVGFVCYFVIVVIYALIYKKRIASMFNYIRTNSRS